jgi:hypothetical protein
MSHSTHVGFNAPFISSGETIVFSFARAPLPPHLQRAAPPVSVTAVGVGHKFRCAAHFCMEGASMFALAVGVGSIDRHFGGNSSGEVSSFGSTPARTSKACSNPRSLPPLGCPLLLMIACRLFRLLPPTRGVGNDPDPIASVRGADGASWHTVPDRIIPERGQVSANGSHPETKQAWDVLHDDKARS